MTNKFLILTLTIIFFFSNTAKAKLSISGTLPKQPLLVHGLLNKPKHPYHEAWLKPIYETLANQRNITCPGYNLVCALGEDDVDEFLRDSLKKYFSYEISKADINKYFKEKSMFVKTVTKNSTQHIYLKENRTKQEIIKIARSTLEIIGKDKIIILGQTPSIIALCMEKIGKNPNIIPVAFSGHPDIFMDNRNKDTWIKAGKNIITKNKEHIYREYLKSKGISPIYIQEDENLYIMDYSTGPSISAFLLFIARWYNEENTKLPNIIFLNLLDPHDKHYCYNGKWVKDPSPKLHMPISQDLSLSVDTIYLNMKYDILSRLVETKDNARSIPSMNAINWHLALHKHTLYPTNINKRITNLYITSISKH